MKTNEAPEKLYLLFNRPYLVDYAKLNKRRFEEEVEYTRTDAFIEKARKYIASHFLTPGMDNEINDFVNYMKGE